MHRSAIRATTVVLLSLVGLVSTGAVAASAADSSGDVTWAVKTASNGFGSDRQNFSYTVEPGGRVSDAFVVVNHGKKPLTLGVYAADGFTTESGQLDLAVKDDKPTGVGAWVRTGKSTVTIPAEKSVEVPFTLTLPKNATPGDHMGGVVTTLTQANDRAGINVDRRLAIRIRLRVGGELAPTLAVENLHVAYAGTPNPFGTGDATVEYTVHNTGNAILSARQTASVAGPFGSFRVATQPIANAPELLPGDSWKVTAKVDGVVPTGLLTAKVALTPLLTDASGSVTPLPTTETTGRGWAVSWTLVLLVVLVVAGVVLLVRRRRSTKAREDRRVEEAVAEAIRERESAGQ